MKKPGLILFLCLLAGISSFSQQVVTAPVNQDSLRVHARTGQTQADQAQRTVVPDSIRSAVEVVKAFLAKDSSKVLSDADLRQAVQWIIYYYQNRPVDSVIAYLRHYPWEGLYTSFMVVEDSVSQNRMDTLYLPAMKPPFPPPDSISRSGIRDSVMSILAPRLPGIRDTLILQAMDTTQLALNDSLAAAVVHRPDTVPPRMKIREVTEWVVVRDTVPRVDSTRMYLTDSLKQAIYLLLGQLEVDSTEIWIKNITNDSLRMMLSDQKRNFFRFWLKNEARDSIGLWLESLGSRGFRVIMDEGVYIRTMSQKKHIDKVELGRQIDERLRKMNKIKVTVPPWSRGAVTSLQFSQGYLSYWAKGGESNIATLLQIEAFANYSKGKSKWENSAQIKTGVLQSGEKGLRKNEDLFEINSSYGEKVVNNWYISILGNLKSQFFKGYDYKDTTIVSNFLAPGYLLFALGMDYKPNKDFSLLISPITSKTTIVTDLENVNPVKYGLEAGQRIKREMGGYVKTRYKKNFSEDISLENKLDLFTSYTNKPQNIDVDWEAILRMKINLYMEANISTHLIYDDDVDIPVVRVINGETIKTTTKKIQFKELLSVGFRYRF